MDLQPHQQRVLEEHKDLAERTRKLADFIQGKVFPTLPDGERSELVDQYEAMVMYQVCLERRLARWGWKP